MAMFNFKLLQSADTAQTNSRIYPRLYDESITFFVVAISIATTILSQIQTMDFTFFIPAIWSFTFGIALVTTRNSQGPIGGGTALMLFYLCIFTVFVLVCTFILQTNYFSDIYAAFVRASLICLCGYYLACCGVSKEAWKWLASVYLLCCIALAFWIQITYLPNLNTWLTSQQYLYASKNSAGQIIAVGIIFGFIFFPQGKVRGFIRLLICTYLLFILIMLQCRTAIISLFFVFVTYNIKLRHYHRLIFICIVIAVMYIFIPTIQSIINHMLLLDKYTGTDIDTFSSGRLELWTLAVQEFLKNPFVGLGNYYIDNFYLNTLVSNGLFGGILIFSYWGIRLIINMNFALGKSWIPSENSQIDLWLLLLVLCLSFFYMIESVFEGMPPLGPGSCSFLFWLLCGYLDAIHISIRSQINKNVTVAKSIIRD